MELKEIGVNSKAWLAKKKKKYIGAALDFTNDNRVEVAQKKPSWVSITTAQEPLQGESQNLL